MRIIEGTGGHHPFKTGDTGEVKPIDNAPPAPDPRIMRVLNSHKLSDIDVDYAFFSIAPWFSLAGMVCDPVADYINNVPHFVPVAFMRYEQPILYGMSSLAARLGRVSVPALDDYCHYLWACPREEWTALEAHLNALILSDVATGFICRTIQHIVPMIDMQWLNKAGIMPSPPPTVSLALYGLRTSAMETRVAAAKNPPLDSIRITLVERGKEDSYESDH